MCKSKTNARGFSYFPKYPGSRANLFPNHGLSKTNLSVSETWQPWPDATFTCESWPRMISVLLWLNKALKICSKLKGQHKNLKNKSNTFWIPSFSPHILSSKTFLVLLTAPLNWPTEYNNYRTFFVHNIKIVPTLRIEITVYNVQRQIQICYYYYYFIFV